MPAKRRVKTLLKRSRTPISSNSSGRSRSLVSGSASLRYHKEPSPHQKQQNKSELNTAQNARRESVYLRQGKTQKSASVHSTPMYTRAHLENIVCSLGLIPGERAMDFALAYDSIGPLLKMRESLEVVPPVAPLGSDKFNLMYVPEVYSPAMRKMRAINKFAEQILMGYRRCTASGCELDVRAAVKAQINKLTDSEESGLGSRLGDEFKRRKSRRMSTLKKQLISAPSRAHSVPSRKNILQAPGVSSSSQQRSDDSSCQGSRRPRKVCSACAQRIASNTAASTRRERRIVLKRHKSTNTGGVPCRVVGASQFTDPNNLPIFYKHIKLNTWM